MGSNTSISWTSASWNYLRGCSRTIAEGATQSGCGDPSGGGCYAERNGWRFAGPGMPYDGLVRMTPHGARWTGKVLFVDEHLLDPIRWTRPRRIFTASVSDPFHERLTNEAIAVGFGIKAATQRHTHQVLTKRARRGREWHAWVIAEAAAVGLSPAAFCFMMAKRYVDANVRGLFTDADRKLISRADVVAQALAAPWPLPNVWAMVSCENQDAANQRIPELLQTPAAVRGISAEPLIGPIDLLPWLDPTGACDCPPGANYCVGGCAKRAAWRGTATQPGDEVATDPTLSFVIAGCESGPKSRDCDTDWLRELRDQCATAGVDYFLKQARGYELDPDPAYEDDWERDNRLAGITAGTGSTLKGDGVIELPYLDGVQHTSLPGSSEIAP